MRLMTLLISRKCIPPFSIVHHSISREPPPSRQSPSWRLACARARELIRFRHDSQSGRQREFLKIRFRSSLPTELAMDSLGSLSLADSPASYVPALLISEEAQDLILHHIELIESPRYARAARRAFAEVHSNWTGAGHRALYRKPFEVSVCWTFEKARNLVETLHSRKERAVAVRSLVGLTGAISAILMDGRKNLTEKYSSEELELLLLVIISASTNLKMLEIPLPSLSFIKTLAKILKGHEDLQEVLLVSYPMYRITPELYSQWASECCTVTPSLKQLTIDGLLFANYADSPLFFATPISSLTLQRCASFSMRDLFRLLPDPALGHPALTELSITTAQIFSPEEMDLLFRHISPNIVRLSLSFGKSVVQRSMPVTVYLAGDTQHRGTPLPKFDTKFSEYTPFPHAHSLTLRNCQEMTPGKLKSIGLGAPHLTKIDLHQTFWSITDDNVQEFEEGLVEILASDFPCLQRADMGKLPFLVGDFPKNKARFDEVIGVKECSFVWTPCSRAVERARRVRYSPSSRELVADYFVFVDRCTLIVARTNISLLTTLPCSAPFSSLRLLEYNASFISFFVRAPQRRFCESIVLRVQ